MFPESDLGVASEVYVERGRLRGFSLESITAAAAAMVIICSVAYYLYLILCTC